MYRIVAITLLLITSCYPLSLLAGEQMPSMSSRELGKTFEFHSKALEGSRIIDLYIPESHDKSLKKYPVVYVHDSSFLFDLTVSLLKNRWSRDLAPESIIVGIQSRDNHERFSFAMPMKREDGSISFENSKPEKMEQFLINELAPFIESKYRTNGYKTLIGMSPTATNVLYDFLKQESYFNAHIAIAPNLEHSTVDNVPLDKAIHQAGAKKTRPFLFLGLASGDLDANADRALPFNYLAAEAPSSKSGIYGFLPEATEHYSVAGISLEQAFAKLFPLAEWLPEYGKMRSSKLPIEYLKTFYEQLEKKVGYEVYPAVGGYWMGNSVTGFSRFLFRKKDYDKALEFLTWADEKVAGDSLINLYLSRAYNYKSDKEQAVSHAEKSLMLARRHGEDASYTDYLEQHLTSLKSSE